MSKLPSEGTAGPRTLRRGLLILRTLQAHDDKGLSVTELSRLTGLQRPTIYRLLAALTECEFVYSVGRTRRYAAAKQNQIQGPEPEHHLIEHAKPHMRELANQFGDAVFLVVREGNDSLTLWREIGPYPVQILGTYANKRQPLGVGSGGLALLAALDDDTIEQIMLNNSKEIEHYGGMTLREMRQLVQNTRTRGYSVIGSYTVRGALGVGCALCSSQGHPLLAISVTAITDRMPARRQKEIAREIKKVLDELSKNL
ncbi:MAG TPA: helix-turn-helix domain-containing protein [Paenalcaligenes sp.]|nr:helix-turn-helix domain-containing protein [Paenalcaligenes sp.]